LPYNSRTILPASRASSRASFKSSEKFMRRV
jgi:hypothetical protein